MSGLIGKKLGMTNVFDIKGNSVGCTVIQAGPCYVTQIKDREKDGGGEGEEIKIYWHLGNSTNWKLTPSHFCHFSPNEKAGWRGHIRLWYILGGDNRFGEKKKRPGLYRSYIDRIYGG